MKDFLEACFYIFVTILAILGVVTFFEGVCRPWCNRWLEKCEKDRIKGGHRRPLDRGDDGTE